MKLFCWEQPLFMVERGGWLIQQLTKKTTVQRGGAEIDWVQLTVEGHRTDSELHNLMLQHLDVLTLALDWGNSPVQALVAQKQMLLRLVDEVLAKVLSLPCMHTTFGRQRVQTSAAGL
mmetsp:Transcript_19498/g.47809  ORF Transcript_19498/g.47809 Transcript_19498/m.47809 type:complete len:118 (+) Transcript_19498:1334-1687(+)